MRGAMADDLAIVNKYNDFYEEAFYAWNPFYPLADRDLRFYLGDQWDSKERQKLFQEGRNAFVFNRARRNINMVTGYQRQHRLSSVLLPVENSDQRTIDQLSNTQLTVMAQADAYKVISDCFGGACKTGWNLLTTWMDYRDDPINGDICYGREPFSGFITDPYLTQLDLSDCAYLIRRKYLFPEHAASLLPGQEKDVYSIHKMGWSRDDKFTWLPYQRQPNGQDLIAFNEFYEQKWKNVPYLVDMETGEFVEWKGDSDRLSYFKRLYPNMEVIKRPKRYIEKNIILNDVYMKTEINPYGLDEYPFVLFAAIFEPESDDWGLKVQSLMRCQIDPQKEGNRRRSQMIDIFDSQINSGYIADEDSVVNPRSLFQTSQGKVIWRKKDAKPGAVEKIPPGQVPPSMFQLQELFDRDMQEILGINDAAFGIADSGNESGIMMMLRQGATLTNLQDVFDNLRYAQKQVTRKTVKLIQTWTPEKVKRIINEEPTEQFFNPELTKYDISIQEGMLTDTQRQMHFRQMADLYQLTGGPGVSPITPTMLVGAAPIQAKSDTEEQIINNEKQQAQSAEQQAQIQQQVLNIQSQLAQATAIEKLMGGKERFTRAVANMGLEDERASRAIENRSQSALNNIKSASEIQNLSQDQVLKALQIVKLLEEMSRANEEQVKLDDVNISARAKEAPIPPNFPVEGENITATSEVANV